MPSEQSVSHCPPGVCRGEPGCDLCDESTKPYPKAPPRGELPPDVLAAVKIIHREVWGEAYRELEGSMHWAGGPYWHDELLRRAKTWERMAEAARVAATFLPEEG